ncbi:C-C motif chemokine 4-like [Rhinatrema bivittatum]|uniref:C-C motif chemokine 4-like n=1 Tax=Rhinatrema bivittatum TaxID=194408 RepID=UPI00112DA282|nr:C-C motif chemokine 4-like [Rhinatrema bivittatum]
MKLFLPALCALLLAVLCSEVSSAPVGTHIPTSCCFSYTSKRIPRGNILAYFYTNSMCPQPGVIFITKKGREVCANPGEIWVQGSVNDLGPQ